MSLTVERVPIPDRTLERVAIPDSKLAREITKEPKPDLTRAMKSLDKRQFETIVGLKGNLGTGVMPAWGDNPNIRPYIENLWAYLIARPDGALGPGRPQKLSTSE